MKLKVWKESLIKKYFFKDYDYKTIVYMLEYKHNVHISLRTLRRILSELKLRKKNVKESSESAITAAIKFELKDSGLNLGYRALWKRLRNTHKLIVKQATVLRILRKLDPDGVEARRKYRLKRRIYTVPGPNWLWHGDGHDKLARYGFCIYGVIDGFSKKVLWLEVSSTNKDPAVILHYYLNNVRKLGFIPTLMRTDKGTEVVFMEDAHMALRYEHKDEFSGLASFLKGKSTCNQRIECYWNQFRKHIGQAYMNLFKNMESSNLYNVHNSIHKECLKFCFGQLIKEDVSRTKREWNEHYIRRQKNADFDGGIPNTMYHWPQRFGAKDCRKPLDLNHAANIMEANATEPILFNQNMTNIVNTLIPDYDPPKSMEEAYYLYLELTDAMEARNIEL